MKQPELGYKLSELRKQKNMTQEELVEACNVSVRTIQRIESGDVTPRMSTVKIIIAALDEDFDRFKTTLSPQSQSELSLDHWLQMAWIAGIVYFIVGFLEGGLDYVRFEEGDNEIPQLLYISVKIVSLTSYILFVGGILKLAELFSNTLLRVGSYLMIGIFFLTAATDVFSLLFPFDDEIEGFLLISQSVTFGAFNIIFGVGLFRLQDGMGRVALFAGLFEIVIGFCFAVVILFFLGFILQVPAIILEVILLFKAGEFVKAEQNVAANS